MAEKILSEQKSMDILNTVFLEGGLTFSDNLSKGK
jgi:hypothetical protein